MNASNEEFESESEPTAGAVSVQAKDEVQNALSLQEAKEYGRISLRCDLLDRLIDLVFLSLAAFLIGKPIDSWLRQFEWFSADRSYLRLGMLFLILYGLHLLASISLSFYSGYVVEHRFGLSHQTLKRWLRNYSLKHFLGSFFGLFMYVGLFWLIWNTGVWWWLAAAGVFFVVSIVMGQIAPVVIMPLYYEVKPLEDTALLDRMKRLTDGTGLEIEGVYRLGLSKETAKANAMLAGLGNTRRVLMGDTLLDEFTADEIDVIFAHEIGHHVHKHIPKMIAMGVVLSLGSFWLCDQFIVRSAAAETRSALETSTLPLVMLGLYLITLIVEPLQNAISRHFERQSDRYAIEKTNDREAYRSAFQKLAKQNKADPDPHPLEVFLFHSHPPIAERLKAAD